MFFNIKMIDCLIIYVTKLSFFLWAIDEKLKFSWVIFENQNNEIMNFI